MDKGGGIVILDKQDYHSEMTKILSNAATYRYVKLSKNPTVDFKKSLADLIDMGAQLGILDKKEKTFLVPFAPQIAVMYYLPKVHKDAHHPPGRPIISGINSVTSRIWEIYRFSLATYSEIYTIIFTRYQTCDLFVTTNRLQ